MPGPSNKDQRLDRPNDQQTGEDGTTCATGEDISEIEAAIPLSISYTPLEEKELSSSNALSCPLDVWYEIFSRLHPRDILNLARASRAFKQTLQSRNASGVWRTAMDRDEAPLCPSGWTDPRWASLIYDEHCQVCLKADPGAIRVNWATWRRKCHNCHEMINEGAVRLRSWAYHDTQLLMDITPHTLSSGRYILQVRTWDRDDLEQTADKLNTISEDKMALAGFIKQRKTQLIEMKELLENPRRISWSLRTDFIGSELKSPLSKKRFRRISRRLEALGYNREQIRMMYRKDDVRKPVSLTDEEFALLLFGIFISLTDISFISFCLLSFLLLVIMLLYS